MSKLLIYNNLKFFFFFIYLSVFSQDKFQNSTLLDQIVLTAQYIPTHIDSSIYSIEIISQESLSDFGSQNLSNVLSRHTGIDVFHDQADMDPARSLRTGRCRSDCDASV